MDIFIKSLCTFAHEPQDWVFTIEEMITDLGRRGGVEVGEMLLQDIGDQDEWY